MPQRDGHCVRLSMVGRGKRLEALRAHTDVETVVRPLRAQILNRHQALMHRISLDYL